MLALQDLLLSIYAVVRILVLDLPLFLLLPYNSKRSNDLSLKDRVPLFIIRRMNTLLPVKAIRWISDIGLPETVLESPRYRPYKNNLFKEEHGPGFCGYWILKSSFETMIPPKHSDIVILYLHGGGYFSSSASTYLLFLLRLAESLIRQHVKTSIFVPEYDLAPEETFPTQLKQATAAYEWLQREHGVSPARLIIMGDSAGGHLALSMLYNLRHPIDDPLARTGNKISLSQLGLILISPWLSLSHQPSSFRRNAGTDVLTAEFLNETAKRFVGPTNNPASASPYLEFLNPNPRIDWKDVLPEWVWVSGGKSEVLYDDICTWVKGRKEEEGYEIESELDKEEPHVYSWLKTTDPNLRKQFLQRLIDSDVKTIDDEFPAIERIGIAILARYGTSQG